MATSYHPSVEYVTVINIEALISSLDRDAEITSGLFWKIKESALGSSCYIYSMYKLHVDPEYTA